ncbi:MAG: folate family ECF transporter S component [bacterium]|nr:folate family ECF transporter S component [bacterium]
MPKIKNSIAFEIALLAIFTALTVVCSMTFPFGLTFRIGTFIKFSPAFIVMAVAARRFGTVYTALIAGVADIIGAFISSVPGISPGITLAAIVSGAIFGLFLYKKCTVVRIVWAVVASQLIGGLVITTVSLHYYYSMPYEPMVYWRLVQTAGMIIIEIVVLYIVLIKTDIPKLLRIIK